MQQRKENQAPVARKLFQVGACNCLIRLLQGRGAVKVLSSSGLARRSEQGNHRQGTIAPDPREIRGQSVTFLGHAVIRKHTRLKKSQLVVVLSFPSQRRTPV